jgi:hypothetical protein
MRITDENWAKSVDAAMPTPRKTREVTNSCLRNAYRVNPEKEYNPGTSVRHLSEMKMYADLAGRKNCKKLGIKSPSGNKVIPIIADSQCPASHLAFVDERYMKMVVHKDEFFRFEPWAKPLNQNVRVAKIYFAGNLVSSNNRKHALFSALAS